MKSELKLIAILVTLATLQAQEMARIHWDSFIVHQVVGETYTTEAKRRSEYWQGKGGEKVKQKVITNNSSERLVIKWDGERFGLVCSIKGQTWGINAIILNPREMLELIEFAGNLGVAKESEVR